MYHDVCNMNIRTMWRECLVGLIFAKLLNQKWLGNVW